MKIGQNEQRYTWDSNWAKLPKSIQPGYTHGVVVDQQGYVYVFNQSRHAVLKFEPDGTFVSAWDEFPSDRFLGAHGMTLVREDDEQYLWLTDQTSCEVVKTTLDGITVMSIEKPATYVEGVRYAPTWAVQSPSDGTIFVADGYGSSVINVYDNTGKYLDAIDGSEGAGRFACPHGIDIYTRPKATGVNDPVLYITDRGNQRVQIFDLQGKFVKSFDQTHPCCFSEHTPGGKLLVPDLQASIFVYDEQDQPIAELGKQADIVGKHGWPNVPTQMRVEGKFNSPHGGTFDADGNIYIVEWIATGRITKLTLTK